MNVNQPVPAARPVTRIVDVDVHLADTPQALAPYCEMPWRKSLEIIGKMPYRHLDVPGFSPGLRIDVPIPGGQPRLHVKDVKQIARNSARSASPMRSSCPTTCCTSQRSRISITALR